jgi:anti-anti-sigma factor
MFFINHIDFGQDSASIIEMDGHLNSESSPDFDEYINKLLENNVIYMLIDMKNLNYISSEGIGAVLMIQKRISEKNGLAIFFNLNFEVFSLFKLLGFDKILTITSNRADALQILDKHIELFPSQGELYDYNNFAFTEKKDREDKSAPLNVELPKSKPNVKEYDEINSFDNFIIECIRCDSLIRINDFGDHRCPFCDAQFTVTDEKKAVFKIKESLS